MSTEPPTVAIIGAGPGGMFFCHALETMKRKLQQEGNETALARLPTVTCFERAAGPGGVWRPSRTFGSAVDTEEKKTESPGGAASYSFDQQTASTTNMYEALWTNGPKEAIEFFDYHFNEHFAYPLPVYMPRQPILEYMIGRVTKHCPDFFETFFKFNTSVEFVEYLEERKKFQVTTLDTETGKEQVQEFDKCIWAGGENGRPKLPQAMLEMFEQGGFRGKIIHSSDTADFENDVKGKRVLLIGGGYSAEDLSLMAIKCGVEKVYVSSRDAENVITWTGAWPQNKVEVLKSRIPIGVTEGGNCIQFAKTYWQWPNKYLPYNNVETEIRDIDTIIMCTGYEPNFQMLHEDLRKAVEKDPEFKLNVPKDWRMKPNAMTDILGEIQAGDCRYINSVVGYYGLYRGMSIDNPNMMFIVTSVDNPLFGIDVDCWLLLRFITGMNQIPSADEMKRQNEADAIRQMENSYLRYCMDHNYYKAWDEAAAKNDDIRRELYLLYYAAKSDHYTLYYRALARSIEEAEYPVSYGSYENLNKTVETLIEYGNKSYYSRANLKPDDKDSEWKTFRDVDNANEFRSVFTGEPSIPLKEKWLDIDANDATILEP